MSSRIPTGDEYRRTTPVDPYAPPDLTMSPNGFVPNDGNTFVGAQPPGGAAAPQQGGFMGFMNTPTGAALINAGGAGLLAYGQSRNSAADREQQGLTSAADLRMRLFNTLNDDQRTRAQGVINADPLGADQKYAQGNALLSAILPGMHMAQSSNGSGRVSAVSSMLPKGGFDPGMVNSMFGPEATQAALVKRNKELLSLDPNAAQSNLTSMYGDSAAQAQTQISDWATKLQQTQGAERAKLEQDMTAYMNQMVHQEKQQGKPGFWHRFAQIAGMAGGIAAMFVPGLQGVGLAGISAAAGAWGSGASPLQTAIAGGTGAAMKYAGQRTVAPKVGG